MYDDPEDRESAIMLIAEIGYEIHRSYLSAFPDRQQILSWYLLSKTDKRAFANMVDFYAAHPNAPSEEFYKDEAAENVLRTLIKYLAHTFDL